MGEFVSAISAFFNENINYEPKIFSLDTQVS